MNTVVLIVAAALLPVIASATDPIAIGSITKLSYRGGFIGAAVVSARAGRPIVGRIVSITSNCSVYQMTAADS
jgi:hypothetical protein